MNGLLLFIAHPDDEVFCSGLLCKVVEAGVPVRIACLTTGEGGRLGEPGLATRETIADVRRREMLRSADVLGVTDVSFLGYVDPEPEGRTLRAPEHEPSKLRTDVAAEIRRWKPAVVLTHGPTGEYGHPAHILLSETVRAVRESASAEFAEVEFYTFAAFAPSLKVWSSPPRNDWVTFTFDATPFDSRRVEALWQHQTQYSVFVDYQDSEADYRTALTDYVRHKPRERYARWPRAAVPSRRVDPLMKWAGVSSTDRGVVSDLGARAFFGFAWRLRALVKGIRKLLK